MLLSSAVLTVLCVHMLCSYLEYFISAGEPLDTVFCFSAGEPLGTSLFSVFPPVVFQVAEGLGYAVHRLAEGDGDLLVLATVVVLPGGDQ